MKKLVFLVTITAFSFATMAQINVIHTFQSQKEHIRWFLSESNGIMFYQMSNDTIKNEVEIYNEDCSLYKVISLIRPLGYTLSIRNVSEQTFNTNTTLEFLCLYYRTSTDCKMAIYDENAILIKDLGAFNFYPEIDIVSNGKSSVLILEDYSSEVKKDIIYSLPQKQTNSIQSTSSTTEMQPYPNPSKTIINLPYSLNGSNLSSMRIFDSNGKLVTQKKISSAFDAIKLNVNNYQPGIYFYEYNGISNKFIVK